MRIFGIWLLRAAFLVASFGANALAGQPPFTVNISAESPTVKMGDPLAIDVVVTNVSKHRIDASGTVNRGLHFDNFDQYDIRDQAGKEVEKNSRPTNTFEGGGEMPILIKPGEHKLVNSDLLNVVYNLNRPGQYTIQLSRSVSRNPKDGAVKSNIITVTVTQ